MIASTVATSNLLFLFWGRLDFAATLLAFGGAGLGLRFDPDFFGRRFAI
jgi:hypothetical protein